MRASGRPMESPLYSTVMAPIGKACAASGGAHGMDARVTNNDSVRDCRLSQKGRFVHRIAAPVAITGGYVADLPENGTFAPGEKVTIRPQYKRMRASKRARTMPAMTLASSVA